MLHRATIILTAASLALVAFASSCSEKSTAYHTHSAADITMGTLANSRLNTGAGGGIDADMIDGQHSTAFATAAHDHNAMYSAVTHNHDTAYAATAHDHDSSYLRLSGGTLTGALTLPSNGLVAGTNQLVLSGGFVGIGVAAPSNRLEVAGTVYSSTSNGNAFRGQTTDPAGAGVYGNSSAGFGIQGVSSGANKSGVDGAASGGHGVTGSTTSASHAGVFGSSAVGDAVWGQCTGGGGSGVVGTTTDPAGAGVNGQSTAGHGVFGQSTATMRNGVYGLSTQNYGIIGETQSNLFAGIHGFSQVGDGVAGTTQATATNFAGSFQGDVGVNGNILKTGTVSFVERHPNDVNKAIVYVCLEAGEVGTYCRGKARLEDGTATVELPEHFTLTASSEGITVQVTPAGLCNGIFVEIYDSSRFTVRELLNGRGNAEFHWVVNGVRKGYENYNPVTDSPKIVGRLSKWGK